MKKIFLSEQSSFSCMKANGIGNHLALFDNTGAQNLTFDMLGVSLVCNNNYGIGADELIVIERSEDKNKYDAIMKVFNPDGKDGGFCGNGIRCVARYLLKGKEFGSKVKIQISNRNILTCELLKDGNIRVGGGKAEFDPKKSNLTNKVSEDGSIKLEDLGLDSKLFEFAIAVNVGSQHCVIKLKENVKLEDIDIAKIGKAIEGNKNVFPNGTNVEFVKILDKVNVEVKAWERGPGVTLSCGSGACSVQIVCFKKGLIEKDATVHLEGGDLNIEIGQDDEIIMSGPAVIVSENQVYMKNIIEGTVKKQIIKPLEGALGETLFKALNNNEVSKEKAVAFLNGISEGYLLKLIEGISKKGVKAEELIKCFKEKDSETLNSDKFFFFNRITRINTYRNK